MRNRSPAHGLRLLGALFSCLLLAGSASGAAIWPIGGWTTVTLGGVDYSDPGGDSNPDPTDLVGGNDGTGDFAAAFWHSSLADDQLSLRMRLDDSGSSSNHIWQFLFETDGDATTIDWVLEVRQSGNPAGRQVIFTPTTSGGPTFNDVALSSTFAWTGALDDWRRWGAAGDGSNFNGNADSFLDVAIPLSTFQAITGLSPADIFQLSISTSTSHTQINKDVPLGLSLSAPVSSAFSNFVPAPEPGPGALTGAGLCALAIGARRRRIAAARSRTRRAPVRES